MTPLLVLHRLGDDRGGAPWREALAEGWDGPSSAFDQPGHGDAPWEADYYEQAHLVIAPLRVLHQTAWSERPVVIAVGVQTTAAQLLALGGRAAAIVLVDAPAHADALDARETQHREYTWLRGIADDPDAWEPAPLGPADPRMRHGLTPRFDPEYAARQRAAIDVPILELDDASPAEVLASVRNWWGDVRTQGR